MLFKVSLNVIGSFKPQPNMIITGRCALILPNNMVSNSTFRNLGHINNKKGSDMIRSWSHF